MAGWLEDDGVDDELELLVRGGKHCTSEPVEQQTRGLDARVAELKALA